jgi:hypothetical protein
MTESEALKFGRQMRAAQKRYFSMRTPQSLNEARDLERKFDAALAELANPPQPGLYDPPNGPAAHPKPEVKR